MKRLYEDEWNELVEEACKSPDMRRIHEIKVRLKEIEALWRLTEKTRA